jgi:hypothetical protein
VSRLTWGQYMKKKQSPNDSPGLRSVLQGPCSGSSGSGSGVRARVTGGTKLSGGGVRLVRLGDFRTSGIGGRLPTEFVKVWG